jgi:adenosylcobinamide-GDP ribazoletransferase
MSRSLVAATTFLTRLPVGGDEVDTRAVAAAAPYYPVVGGAIGAAAGAAGAVLALILPHLVAGALVVALAVAATGAIHIDGLADTADAAGGRTPAERLRIMRDHSVGAFGATAVALFVVVEVAAISTLLEDGLAVAVVLLAVFAASRSAAAPLAALLPYARDKAGVPVFFTRRGALAGVVVAAILCAPAGLSGLAALGAAAVVVAAGAAFYRRWLGGITGDALGATVAVAEALALVAATAVR